MTNPTPEQVEAAARAMRERSTWPSMHWPDIRGVDHIDTSRALATAALIAAAGVTPQEPGEVCAWCPNRARGDAWHNDGKLYPSCGSIGHGGGWVPPYFPHSAIDEVALSEALLKVYDHGSAPNALKEARVLIASRAEWLRGGGQ